MRHCLRAHCLVMWWSIPGTPLANAYFQEVNKLLKKDLLAVSFGKLRGGYKLMF